MSLGLTGRSIVVTGASRGLGRAIATACAAAGAQVGLCFHRDEAAATTLAAELEARHGRPAPVVRLDAKDPDSIDRAMVQLNEQLPRIDGFVCNAAVVRPALLVTSSVEQLREQIDTNLLGPLLCARAVLPVMMRQRSGVMLFVSSVAAERPVRGQAAYAASKGGVEALTRALAGEYARKGVRVLCLRPGPMHTDMLEPTVALAGGEIESRIALGRIASPDEVAQTAVFLLGESAAYATGSIVAVDGGWGLT